MQQYCINNKYAHLLSSPKSNNLLPSAPTFNTIGVPFIQLNSVESTNNYLLDKVRNGLAAHGTAVFAQIQTAGKGQRGKVWQTEPDSNIILSLAIDTSFIPLTQQFAIGAMAALSVYDFFCKYADDATKIKWPNDLYWRDRKAGGILIETVNVGNGQWTMDNEQLKQKRFAVVGIGININQTTFPASLKNPVSLKQITGKNFNAVDLAKELCTCFEKQYQRLINKQQAAMLIDYNNCLYKKNETVKLKKENIVFDALITAVNTHGELLVSNALHEKFTFGEIEWIL